MRALDAFLAAYEAEHSEITETEMREATRRTRARAEGIRPSRPSPQLSDHGGAVSPGPWPRCASAFLARPEDTG